MLDEKEFERLDELSDDESIVELDKLVDKNDVMLAQDELSAVVEQQEQVVYYEIENIFKDETARAYRNRLRMRTNPPVLIVKDSNGNEVKFALTENLTEDLLESLKEVETAYYGFSRPDKRELPDKFMDRLQIYMKESPVKVIFTGLTLMVLISVVLRMIATMLGIGVA